MQQEDLDDAPLALTAPGIDSGMAVASVFLPGPWCGAPARITVLPGIRRASKQSQSRHARTGAKA